VGFKTLKTARHSKGFQYLTTKTRCRTRKKADEGGIESFLGQVLPEERATSEFKFRILESIKRRKERDGEGMEGKDVVAKEMLALGQRRRTGSRRLDSKWKPNAAAGSRLGGGGEIREGEHA